MFNGNLPYGCVQKLMLWSLLSQMQRIFSSNRDPSWDVWAICSDKARLREHCYHSGIVIFECSFPAVSYWYTLEIQHGNLSTLRKSSMHWDPGFVFEKGCAADIKPEVWLFQCWWKWPVSVYFAGIFPWKAMEHCLLPSWVRKICVFHCFSHVSRGKFMKIPGHMNTLDIWALYQGLSPAPQWVPVAVAGRVGAMGAGTGTGAAAGGSGSGAWGFWAMKPSRKSQHVK